MIVPLLTLWAHAASIDGAEVRGLAAAFIEAVPERHSQSPGARAAQIWIAEELFRRGWTPETLPIGAEEGVVLACREGEDPRTLLLLAHPDSVHDAVPGANDNAAAVAALLVAASRIEARPPRRVCLGFPGGEELGLLGSTALAAQWEGPLDHVVALDLVGRGQPTHNGLSRLWTAPQLRALLRTAPAAVPWVYRALSVSQPQMERSDHGPFTRRGIRASHWMARAESGVYPPYHTDQDTLDWLEDDTLSATAEAMVALAHAPPLPTEGRPGPHAVLPGLGMVVDSRWLSLLGALLALAGAWACRARGEEGASLREHAMALSPVLLGLAGAGLCWLVVLGQQPSFGQVPGAAALLWAGATSASLWGPACVPLAARRTMVGLSMVLGAGLWATAGILLALPVLCWCALAAAWRWRSNAAVCAMPLALWAAGYFLRPNPMRELAFHHLLPISPWLWAPLAAVLLAPWLFWLSASPHRGRLARVSLGLLFVAVLFAGTRPLADPLFDGREMRSAHVP